MFCGNYILSNGSRWTFYFSKVFNLILQSAENFPIDKSKFSKKIQEEAIKLLILQIIDKEENINEIRTEFNEK